MKKVYCDFSQDEFEQLESRAKELGYSVKGLVEYAAMLYVDMPRSIPTNVTVIQNTIDNFIQTFIGDSFICSTPFGTDWAKMTTSAKRTAAAILSKKEKAGAIVKLPSTSKHHEVTRYKKP